MLIVLVKSDSFSPRAPICRNRTSKTGRLFPGKNLGFAGQPVLEVWVALTAGPPIKLSVSSVKWANTYLEVCCED